jgi:hypothetical protein
MLGATQAPEVARAAREGLCLMEVFPALRWHRSIRCSAAASPSRDTTCCIAKTSARVAAVTAQGFSEGLRALFPHEAHAHEAKLAPAETFRIGHNGGEEGIRTLDTGYPRITV